MMFGVNRSSRSAQSEHEMMISIEKDLLLALRRKKISKEAKIILEEMLCICQQYREIIHAQ